MNLSQELKAIARACNALYICPKNTEGKRLGPLVAYAGKDSDGKNLVGDIYFNFRMIESRPCILERFADEIFGWLLSADSLLQFDTVCGIPEGGRTLAQAVARRVAARFVYASKIPIPTEPGKKQEYRWDLSQFDFARGERLLVMEDVINNLQNTSIMLEQIASTGAQVVLLGAALNRSPFADTHYTPSSGPYANVPLPIVCAIREPYPEYKQSDPAVMADVAAGNVEFAVKKHWSNLMTAMEIHSPSAT